MRHGDKQDKHGRSLKASGLLCCVAAVFLAVSLTAALAGCGQPGAGVEAAPGKAGVSKYGKGYRFDCNGWTYLHIEGGPYERGYQHGRLAAKEIGEIERTLERVVYQETGKEWSFFVVAAQRIFLPHADGEFLDEIKGIADGARSVGTDVSWQGILAWNGYFELVDYWWPNEKAGKYAGTAGVEQCSAFIATGSYTRGGRVVMAHNTWNEYSLGQFANVVLDIVPQGGHRIFMQSYPGLIHSSTDFFLTDAAVMGTETTLAGFSQFDPGGVPEFFRARRAMQYAGGLDEFVSIMGKGNNGGYANAWLLANANSGEIMLFEQGLAYQNVERKNDGYFIGFNAATDPRIRNLECDGEGYYDVKDAVGARRVRLTQLMEDYRGKLDTATAETVLADHYDVYLNEADHPCWRTVEGRVDLDPFTYTTGHPAFYPAGAVDGKVTDGDMARGLGFIGRWGSSSGLPFDASEFLAEHAQYSWLRGVLEDRPTEPWTRLKAGQK